MKSIRGTMTVRSVIEKYPDTKGLFVAAGMGDLVEGDRYRNITTFLSLQSVLKALGKDPHTFIKTLTDHLASTENSYDAALRHRDQGNWDAVGVIPMAVHLKMLEVFEDLRRELKQEHGLEFGGRMASAQEGGAWITEAYRDVTDPGLLPDVCLGRGYDFFFDRIFQERFIETGVYNVVRDGEVNPDFNGLDLPDPGSNYNVLAVIPAVIIVREKARGTLPIPRSWERLLDKRYRNSVCMPDCNIDLPRAVLLTLYSRFGEEGVQSLAHNIAQLMHPSQFVRKLRAAQNDVPAFTVMPYFFAQVVSSIPGIRVVWPDEGAIIEPLYTLAKSDRGQFKSDPRAVKAAADLFMGQKVASLFAKAHFPALHPRVDNGLPAQASFWWIGWDFLQSHDVTALGARLEQMFQKHVAAKAAG
ncbi:MAG: ABC transporter substrate-binding protein [Chlorobiales bacterium]|nr:ABC transporter substrate-binding protein [Chlorobiales bacterium]